MARRLSNLSALYGTNALRFPTKYTESLSIAFKCTFELLCSQEYIFLITFTFLDGSIDNWFKVKAQEIMIDLYYHTVIKTSDWKLQNKLRMFKNGEGGKWVEFSSHPPPHKL